MSRELQEKLKLLEHEKFRMQCAYDNLYSDSDLYRVYTDIERMIRETREEIEDQNKTHNGEAAGVSDKKDGVEGDKFWPLP